MTAPHPALLGAAPTSPWLDSPLRPEPRPALAADTTADLVVVGGGYSGLWTAVLAKERGLDVREVRHDREGDYHTLVAVEVETGKGPRRVAGTLFGNKAPRLVELFGVEVEAELDGTMIYIVNTDAPGFIGKLGTTLGEAGINIATFNLGRRAAGPGRPGR